MKRFIGTLAVLVSMVAFAPPASAHQGNPNFRSEVTSITPASAADGLRVEIENFDDNVQLTNRTGKEVVVDGYDGEPYFRIRPDGTVEVNLNSPAYYLNQDRFADVSVPDRADAKADPDWEEVDTEGVFSWHDHRSHYMGLNTPPQVEDESKKTKVFDYSIPASVGGTPVEIDGTLTWVGKQDGFPFLPFLLLAVLIVAGVVAISVIRRRRDGDDDGSGPDEPEDRKETAEAW